MHEVASPRLAVEIYLERVLVLCCCFPFNYEIDAFLGAVQGWQVCDGWQLHLHTGCQVRIASCSPFKTWDEERRCLAMMLLGMGQILRGAA